MVVKLYVRKIFTGPPDLAKKLLTPMLTHDLFPVANLLVICADDVVRRRGYSDHIVTMYMCMWVCVLARQNENP